MQAKIDIMRIAAGMIPLAVRLSTNEDRFSDRTLLILGAFIGRMSQLAHRAVLTMDNPAVDDPEWMFR